MSNLNILRRKRFMIIMGLVLFVSSVAIGQLKVSGMFTDHMVLQRDVEIPVWGWANPGQVITATLGKINSSATTNSEGRWKLTFPPQSGGFDSYMLSISSEKGKQTFSDILIGDVWLASGQSNMGWQLKNSNNADEEIQNANFPNIRLYTVPRIVSREPRSNVNGEWSVCSPETAMNFSAVAYFFGREIFSTIDVPIGLINSSWGGTPSEAWTSLEALENHADYREKVANIKASRDDFDQLYREQNKNMTLLRPIVEKVLEEDKGIFAAFDLEDSNWPEMNVPIHFHNTEIAGFQGIAWLRKHITLTKEQSKKDLVIELGMIEQADKSYLNGISIGETNNTMDQRSYIVPAKLLKKGDNVIAIRIKHMRNGGGGIHGGSLRIIQEGKELMDISGDWKYNHKLEHDLPFSKNVYQYMPGTLYNAMIAPVIPFAIKGAIWYQGESNAGRACQYREIFPSMIHDWRVRWQQGHFPFLFVQLANFRQIDSEPTNSSWAELREAQSMTLNLPNTGQAVIIDIGEADDIHPRNKQDVGKRLALSAQKIAYKKDIVHSGPTYHKLEIDGNEAVLHFNNFGSGLIAKGTDKLTGFAIAGTDGKFIWAEARIEGMNRVVVYHPDISEPTMVRYAWANNPICNLYNKEGLPASPFRTDDLRGVTYGNK